MVTCREGNQDDIENISTLLVDTWKNCYKDFIPSKFLNSLSIERQIQRHTTYMQANTRYLVAENELKDLLGFLSYGNNRIEKVNCGKELYTLYVRINNQGKGIGHLLLDTMLTELNGINANLTVSVFKNNPFQEFYVKNGFVKIDEEIIDMGEFELTGEIFLKTVS